MTLTLTLTDIKARCKQAGSHWFEPGAIHFFDSKFERKVMTIGADEALFVSSEQYRSPRGDEPRRWSVRYYHEGQIDTLGEFQQYATRVEALDAMAGYAREVKKLETSRLKGVRYNALMHAARVCAKLESIGQAETQDYYLACQALDELATIGGVVRHTVSNWYLKQARKQFLTQVSDQLGGQGASGA